MSKQIPGRLKRLCSVLSVMLVVACAQPPRVLISTPAGPISGITDEGITKFLGIPYAETTGGDNRWRPPIAKAAWRTPLDASKFGPWCPQFDFERRDEGEVHAGEGWTIFRHIPPNPDSSEDCLSLNVFAPPLDDTLKPVMVFIHGNALGSSFPLYDGTEFAKSGIVFVSLNFRLHTMGIFAHPALTNEAHSSEPLGRYSEMDRLAALRWVQDNIASFGGDPDQVTVVGQSEGGAAILQMLGHGRGKGLFHQAIVQSGNGWWSPMRLRQHEQLGCYLAALAGLDGCEATPEALRAIDWDAYPVSGPYSIDQRSVHVGATQGIDLGNALDIPIMIGWNDFDGSSLRFSPERVVEHTHPGVLAHYDRDQDLESLAYAIYTDRHSGAPARWAAKKFEDGHPAYLYLFSYVVSWDRGSVRGAEHGYELPHVFKTFEDQLDDMFPFLSNILLTDDERQMQDIMHACWVSFIKTGTPQCPGGPTWPRYTRASDALMVLDLKPRVLKGYRAAQLNAQEAHLADYLDRIQESFEDLIANGIAGE